MDDDFDDDLDEGYEPEWLDEPPLDPVAARAEAFWKGIALLVHISDPELRREGMMMLGAIRRSFKTLPAGDLTSIPGGKAQ
ncbi:MAG: hypothetical protein ACR2HL_06710 [Methylocystis sp.]